MVGRRQSVEMALRDLNEGGGVNGCKLVTDRRDLQSQGTVASSLTNYLQRFPEGEFAELARDRITALSQAPSQTLPVGRAVDADTAVELSFWESVRVSDNPDMYEAYLEKYLNGEFVPLARVRLEELRQ